NQVAGKIVIEKPSHPFLDKILTGGDQSLTRGSWEILLERSVIDRSCAIRRFRERTFDVIHETVALHKRQQMQNGGGFPKIGLGALEHLDMVVSVWNSTQRDAFAHVVQRALLVLAH